MRKVILINFGKVLNGEVHTSPFVLSQANSLKHHWKVIWGLTQNTSFVDLIKTYFLVKDKIKNEKPDIVHAQYGSMTSFFAWAVKGDIKLVVSFCGDDILGTHKQGLLWRIRESIAKKLSLFVAERADQIIVKSDGLKNQIPIHLHRKTTIIPNGVNVKEFHPIERVQAYGLLKLSERKKFILFNVSTGNNQGVKNYPLAKKTMDLVKRVEPDSELLAVGSVDPMDMPLYINASSVVLLTSLHEGSPNIIKEAMACNVLVVSVPCGDVLERITDDSIGYVCPYDAEKLAEKIVLILKGQRRSTGRENLLKQGLSTEEVSKKIESIYNLVLSK